MGMISNIKMILTLKCDESAELLSKQQDVSLTPSERWALRLHLLICRSCRRYRHQLDFLRRAFRFLGSKGQGVPPELRMSDEKRDQLKDLIRKKGDFEK